MEKAAVELDKNIRPVISARMTMHILVINVSSLSLSPAAAHLSKEVLQPPVLL